MLSLKWEKQATRFCCGHTAGHQTAGHPAVRQEIGRDEHPGRPGLRLALRCRRASFLGYVLLDTGLQAQVIAAPCRDRLVMLLQPCSSLRALQPLAGFTCLHAPLTSPRPRRHHHTSKPAPRPRRESHSSPPMPFSRNELAAMLHRLTSTPESIRPLAAWMLKYMQQHAAIVDVWMNEFSRMPNDRRVRRLGQSKRALDLDGWHLPTRTTGDGDRRLAPHDPPSTLCPSLQRRLPLLLLIVIR
jgi:hypothetical protein